MRYFIYLSYDGARYHGWQIQPNGISVQEVLNKALSTLLREPIEVTGAGRTDAGVNASLMVAHFDTKVLINSPCAWAGRLNRFLPSDIAIHKIVPVTDDAHARFSATSRTYHYYIITEKSPFEPYAYRFPQPLDFDKMNEAAQTLFDYIDFTSFSKLHTDVKTNNCRIKYAKWEQISPIKWQFTITADRFLRNMVRAIVGTLLDVGRGVLTIQQFREIIEKKDRCSAGTSVPGNALFLADITYPEELFEVQIFMASNQDLVQYIADQCAGAGEISVKKMFGDYGIYCDGKIFGLICDDHLYIKPTEAGRAMLRTFDPRPPYPGAKDHFCIADIDDHEYLSELVRVTCKELPMPKPKKKLKSQTSNLK